jgi:hypothetical protein
MLSISSSLSPLFAALAASRTIKPRLVAAVLESMTLIFTCGKNLLA